MGAATGAGGLDVDVVDATLVVGFCTGMVTGARPCSLWAGSPDRSAGSEKEQHRQEKADGTQPGQHAAAV